MKKNIILFILLSTILLIGCSDKELKVPLEDVGMVSTMAFDYIDEDTMKMTVAIPQFSPEAKENTQTFSVSTDMVSKGIVEIEMHSDKKIVLNQLRVVLFNEEFAQHGEMEKIVRHFYRESSVGNKVLIAIVNDTGEQILKADYPDKPNINMYINDLLQPSINTAFNPNTNIHDFIYTQTSTVHDSIVPLLEKKDGTIKMEGIAIFKGHEMLQSLTADEALIIQALQGRKNLAPLSLELDGGKEKLMLDLITNKVNMKSNENMESPKLVINIKFEGTLVEYSGEKEDSLHKLEEITKLEEEINERTSKQIEEFLDKLKELEVDPVGLAEEFRRYYHGDWDKKKTNDIISKLEVDVQVETSIISTGNLK
ncbi:Ger(x)C family spore germination protein [Psychrobacillus sp. INOP01]|uniref:Ger(x)C family spore germination protein n=1 Tax=Psychrobacillus sp. INOP01 TaxID=2829187 RepID=UPI001BA5D41B|nr:Ger(x)C family spore germination protein [Psychrobacillus sp. INOP01]QUG40302.1 Ger(x)C family spore germination protein [Psychrobacillus sp. INOP01]